MGEIREPIKKSSIEKKNRIIEKGFELMCEKGYHNITCVDIAKYADVSTGIIYQYFSDKRDIFIAGINNYSNNILYPMISTLKETKIDDNNLRDILSNMIDAFIKTHTMSKKAHEELNAMSCLDGEIADIFTEKELETTTKICDLLISNGYRKDNINERVHLVYNMVDNYCHEVVYHKHKNMDYDYMKNNLIDIIIYNIK